MTNRHRTNRRPIAPKLVRQMARDARLSLEELANAIMDGQPEPPTTPEADAIVHDLIETEREVRPGIDDAALTEEVQRRVTELLGAGNPVIAAMSEQLAHEFIVNRARVAIAVMGARWHPTLPTVPKPARIDAIADTVLSLTGTADVADDTVQAIYGWLFGDEALYVHQMELRVEAGQRIVANPQLQQVLVRHPDTGERALVTRAEVKQYGDADVATMVAAHEYVAEQLRFHSRVMLLMERYARRDDMTVGEALNIAARENGIEPAGHDARKLVDVVWAAVEGTKDRA